MSINIEDILKEDALSSSPDNQANNYRRFENPEIEGIIVETKKTYGSKPSSPPTFSQLFFISAGICSLLGWNAVLSALDYFSKYFPSFNVPFYMPIPKFIGQVIALLLIFEFAKRFSERKRVVENLIIQSILFFILPFTTLINNEYFGFTLGLILMFAFGFLNSLLQGTFIALTMKFPAICASLFWTGSGVAGLIIGLVRMIILLCFGEKEEGLMYGTIIYFALGGITQIATIWIYFKFKETEYSKIYCDDSQANNIKDTNENINIKKNNDYDRALEVPNEEIPAQKDEEKKRLIVIEKNGLSYVWVVLKKIWMMAFLVWLIFVVTFTMFPGVTLKRRLSFLSDPWSVTLMIFSYNIFDTIGKYLAKFRWSFNSYSVTLTVFARFLFFMPFLMIAKVKYENDSWYMDIIQILNTFGFGLTNGYAMTCTMIIASERVSYKEKEDAGFIMSFPVAFGITCGCFVALIFENV